jgi:hypothetical protein
VVSRPPSSCAQSVRRPTLPPLRRRNAVKLGRDEMSEPVFLVALGIAGTTLVLVAGAIAGAIRGRGSSRSGVTQLSDELKDHAAALEDLQSTLLSQSHQLAELNERLDFTERLLAQSRDRIALKPDSP